MNIRTLIITTATLAIMFSAMPEMASAANLQEQVKQTTATAETGTPIKLVYTDVPITIVRIHINKVFDVPAKDRFFNSTPVITEPNKPNTPSPSKTHHGLSAHGMVNISALNADQAFSQVSINLGEATPLY